MSSSSGAQDPVDPQLLDLLESLPTGILTPETLPQWRSRSLPPGYAGIPSSQLSASIRTVSAGGRDGAPDVPLRVYRPGEMSGRLPCVYHMHGGGFVSGAAAEWDSCQRMLCAELSCVIVSVDYRLAPETRFPGNIEDCYAGLDWVFRHADELDVDTQRIGLKGESAGGGLAAALALLVRDRGELSLAFQHLTYPMLDDRISVVREPNPLVGEWVWTRQNNHFGWSALLGREPGGEGVSLYAAPARAESLAGLPPTFLATAALDLFLEENIEYARRLLVDGVPVEFHVYPGAFHGFDLHPTATVACAARRDSCAALARLLSAKRLSGQGQ